MKKVLILTGLMLFVGCATAPPNVEVKPFVSVIPEFYIIKAEHGYLECFNPEVGRLMTTPFRGDVTVFREWLTFQPHVEGNIKKITTRLVCQVFVLDKLSYTDVDDEKEEKYTL